MLTTNPHDQSDKTKAWAFCENGSAAAIAKGLLCAWDLTDYTGQAIAANTRGYRVAIFQDTQAASDTPVMAGVADKLIPANPAPNSNRNPPSLIQIYGFRSDLQANAIATSSIEAGALIRGGDQVAGMFQGSTDTGLTAGDAAKGCGFSFVAVADATTTTFDGFLRMM